MEEGRNHNTNRHHTRDTTLNIAKLFNMFSISSSSGGRGSGWIILQILRVFSILGLAAVGAASWALIINYGIPTPFIFFKDVSLFFVSLLTLFLIATESEFLFREWIEENFPVFGPQSGFTWLGVAMMMLGCHTMGELSHAPNTFDKLGAPMWRLTLAAGILSFTFGVFNIIASFCFKNSESGISAREIRNNGAAIADAQYPGKTPYDDYPSTVRSNSVRSEKQSKGLFGGLFKKKEKNERPNISAPITYTRDIEAGDELHDHSRSSPIMPSAVRPPSAAHPAFARSSIYSEASHIPRH